MNSKMIRIFLALPLSDKFALDIRYAMDQLKPQIDGVKWGDPYQVHVTLHFFGDVPSSDVPRISEIIQPVIADFRAPAVCLKGTGCFPDEEHPKIIWLGVGGEKDRISELHRRLETHLRTAGFTSEDRDFVPHATIGRVRKDKRPIWTVPAALRNWQTDILSLSQVVLYRSQLSPQGPFYESLGKFPFAV